MLGNSLYGAVSLIKNFDPDKYFHAGYGIGFDVPGLFSMSDSSGIGKNVIILSSDVISSSTNDNKKR